MGADGGGAVPKADVSDMLAIHAVFRDAFDDADRLIPGIDPERVELVGSYYANVLALLHVHHEGEDELLFPRLVERCPGDAETIVSLQSQHHALDESLPAAQAAVAQWQADPTQDNTTALLAALAAVRDGAVPHFDEEEATILPLAAATITAPEWGELPAHGMANFTGDRIWLILGLIREKMTQEQRDDMLVHMPPPAAEFWTSTGEPLFVDYMAQLRA